MQGMMDAMMRGGMMWGAGFFWLLILLVLVLAAGALVKYLFFSGRGDSGERSLNIEEAQVSGQQTSVARRGSEEAA